MLPQKGEHLNQKMDENWMDPSFFTGNPILATSWSENWNPIGIVKSRGDRAGQVEGNWMIQKSEVNRECQMLRPDTFSSRNTTLMVVVVAVNFKKRVKWLTDHMII